MGVPDLSILLLFFSSLIFFANSLSPDKEFWMALQLSFFSNFQLQKYAIASSVATSGVDRVESIDGLAITTGIPSRICAIGPSGSPRAFSEGICPEGWYPRLYAGSASASSADEDSFEYRSRPLEECTSSHERPGQALGDGYRVNLVTSNHSRSAEGKEGTYQIEFLAKLRLTSMPNGAIP